MMFEAHYLGHIRIPSAGWNLTRRAGRSPLDRLAEPEPRCTRSIPPASNALHPVMDTDEEDAERWDGLA